MDKKTELPIHLVFGATDNIKIKFQEMLWDRHRGEPVAEQTHFRWIMMSPGKEAEIKKLMWMKTFIDDNENLCRLDVSGVTNIALVHIAVHHDFKDQLRRIKDCWYKTVLMWKDNSISLQSNKLGSFRMCCKIYKEIKNYLRVMIRLFKNKLLKE